MSKAKDIDFNKPSSSTDPKRWIPFWEQTIVDYKKYMYSDVRRACYWQEELRKAEKKLADLKALP